MNKGEPIFRLENVCKNYKMEGDVETKAVCGVTISVRKGEYIAIIGASGSGKSTLMHLMGCLDTPTAGKIFIGGKDVSRLESDELARIRREKIGFIFQAYNLINTLTALENVALPMRFNGVSKSGAEKKARELLEMVGLSDRMHHRPNQLSGGQQQRVAIARALINNPDAILADEPTGNLDTKSGEEVVKLIESLNHKYGKTIVVVTHHLGLAKRAKRRIYIKDGGIEKED
jgi:putative ABC transport system ATP-binding protein